ncbi:MAG TPA: hypothetical protein DD379_08080 [Cyanobacteria bacterium UBA11162]|nr:hypothetical protein [Cyanobacteria bacterium UBA11162]
MKITELKDQVYQCWTDLSNFKGAVIQPENFKQEVRQYGDLRRKSTWEKAYAAFWAKNCYDSCLDAWTLIRYSFNFTLDRWDYEYRYQIIEEFLQIPGAIELIQLGLEQLLSQPFTQHDRRQAHGFFELTESSFLGNKLVDFYYTFERFRTCAIASSNSP